MILDNLKKRVFTSIALFILLILILYSKFFLIYFLIVIGVFSIIEFFNLTKKIFLLKFSYYFFNFLFLIFIFIFSFLFVFFSYISELKTILYILLFGCIASDIGGFICGKTFKGPKLSKISPNKTIAGAIGSIFFSTILVSCSFLYLLGIFNIKIFIIGLMTSIFCQLGDLIFSLLKRKAKLKDTGNILPGHGGVLDRLDGIFFGIPGGLLIFIILI